MKELNSLHQDNTRDERKQHQEKSMGTWRLPTGMKLWQIDPATDKVEEVVYKMARSMDKVLGNIKGKDITVKQTALKVEMNPLFFYCKAINQKNALRKYFKSQFYAAIRNRRENSGNPS